MDGLIQLNKVNKVHLSDYTPVQGAVGVWFFYESFIPHRN